MLHNKISSNISYIMKLLQNKVVVDMKNYSINKSFKKSCIRISLTDILACYVKERIKFLF